jgi:hypothetical protein
MVVGALKPLRHLPPLQRRFSIVLFLALTLGSFDLSWDHRKQFWFVLAVLAAQVVQRSSGRAVPRAPEVRTVGTTRAAG